MLFIKKLLAYAIGNALSKLIAIIILPIYTRHINPFDYGQVDLIYNAVPVLVSIFFMEIWTALLRFIFDNNSKHSISTVYTNAWVISTFMLLPFLVAQGLVCLYIDKSYFLWACLYGISLLVSQIMQMMARGNSKVKIFIASGIINSMTQLVTAYILVSGLKIGPKAVLIAPFVGCVASCLLIEIKCNFRNYINIKLLNKTFIRRIIIFSAPLSLNSVAYWAMNNINRYFAAYFLGYEASSYISVAAKLSMVILLASSVYTLAWQESAFEKSQLSNRASYYTYMFKSYVALFTGITAVCIVCIKIVFPYLVGKEYWDSIYIIPFYFLAVYFSGINAFLGQVFNAEKKTGRLLLSTVAGTFVNILLIIILTPRYGITFIPISSIVGYFICSLMRYINIRVFVKVDLHFDDVIKAFILIGISVLCFYMLQSNITILGCLFVIIIILVFLYFDFLKNLFKTVKVGVFNGD